MPDVGQLSDLTGNAILGIIVVYFVLGIPKAFRSTLETIKEIISSYQEAKHKELELEREIREAEVEVMKERDERTLEYFRSLQKNLEGIHALLADYFAAQVTELQEDRASLTKLLYDTGVFNKRDKDEGWKDERRK